MANPLRSIVGVTLRWAGAWAILGLLLGITLMFGRVEIIAESGRKPSDLGSYAFWIPLTIGVASVFGVLLGLLFACLMVLMDLWRPPAQARPGVFTTYGQRLICGALAGGLIGLPLTRDWNAVIFVGLGLASALVSSLFNRPAAGN